MLINILYQIIIMSSRNILYVCIYLHCTLTTSAALIYFPFFSYFHQTKSPCALSSVVYIICWSWYSLYPLKQHPTIYAYAASAVSHPNIYHAYRIQTVHIACIHSNSVAPLLLSLYKKILLVRISWTSWLSVNVS